jgi:hypothetical protein
MHVYRLERSQFSTGSTESLVSSFNITLELMMLTADQCVPPRHFPEHHQNSGHHGYEIRAQLRSNAMLFRLLGNQLRVPIRACPTHEEACLCQDHCFLPCNNRLCYLDFASRRHRFVDAQPAICLFRCGKEMAHH